VKKTACYPSLEGKHIFITGGASGIGAAMVERFCLQNANVAFIDYDANAAAVLLKRLTDKTSAKLWFRQVDVTNLDALKDAILAASEEFGSVFALVNNVANDARHHPDDVTPQTWRDCMAVNLDASFFAAQTAAKKMQQSGSIINLSSINALLGPANMPGYVTAKAGLIGMTKALARDYGARNIRVNALLPGWVVTERQLDSWLTPEAEQDWQQHVALKQRINPNDVANLALFLAADESRMITGQSFTIDAGRT